MDSRLRGNDIKGSGNDRERCGNDIKGAKLFTAQGAFLLVVYTKGCLLKYLLRSI